MQADHGADGAGKVGCLESRPESGQKVYHSWRGDRVQLTHGRYEVYVDVTVGTVEMVGDRPLVRHGAVYEDMSELWYATKADAMAAQAGVIEEMAAGLLEQAKRLRDEKGPPVGVV